MVNDYIQKTLFVLPQITTTVDLTDKLVTVLGVTEMKASTKMHGNVSYPG